MATNELHQSSRVLPWIDPADAVERLTDHQPQLLLSAGAHPLARYSFLGLSAAHRLAIIDGEVQGQDGPRDPIEALRYWSERFRFDVDEDHFTGGWIGMFDYESHRLFEPTLAGPRGRVDWQLCRDAIVFDHHDKTATLWVADLPGESGRDARADTLIAALGMEVPRTTAPEMTWRAGLDGPAFEAAVEVVRDHVRQGDLFQANIATRFTSDAQPPPAALLRRLVEVNPSPFMCLLDWGDRHVISNSPERLFAAADGRIGARPIAGTRPRGHGEEDDRLEQELRSDEKEQAEHRMLVDLLRNDLAKVCVPGSVRVPGYASVERYARVMHLVSQVEGELEPSRDVIDMLAAVFPGGTITGAPKHRACQRIAEVEPIPRGPYTGSAGYLSWSGRTDWNILIRTFVRDTHGLHVHAGSGIVMDSRPAREWQEAGHKAAALVQPTVGLIDRIGEVSPGEAWAPSSLTPVAGKRVLLIDNYDSFVYNLADGLAALGAEVRVLRNDASWQADAEWATHVVLSPGPGRPEEAGFLLEIARWAIDHRPTLGVCLGHQAMALADGGSIGLVEAVHGKLAEVEARDCVLFDAGRLQVARYHSLVVDGPPKGWGVTARAGKLVMAMEKERAFGLQFHPESVGTPTGLSMLRRFLEVA